MKKIKISTVLLLSLLFLISGCSSAQGNNSSAQSNKNVITVAYNQAFYPYDFLNKENQADGFEVKLLQEVAKQLPQYEFEFVGTSDDDILIGVETGKYDIGLKGIWYTEERAKKYVFPQNNIAVSVIGITFRTENKNEIHDMESFAKFSGKLVPIAPQSAQWAIVEEYNTQHPDEPVTLIASENFVVADAYKWVAEGRYDAYFDIKLAYENSILNEDGAQHHFAETLSYVPYKAIPTWPIFNKNNQTLANEYDEALTKVKETGIVDTLAIEYFGENLFQYVEEN